MSTHWSRRRFFPAAVAAVSAGCQQKQPTPARRPSPVFIGAARSYSEDLTDLLVRGAQGVGLEARGKRVLLKPNLVEFDSKTVINTNVAVLHAAVELFERLGAAEVRIGEGPGHRRDTWDLTEDVRYRTMIPRFDERFLDLNRDDVSPVRPFADLPELYFPNTVLAADLIVSVAKMKTHHWAGATLSMKNFFGVVPGAVYGWPKNILHHVGIPESIVELNRVFRRTFAIVDGIIGMEGNGPIQGTPVESGVVVMGPDLPAVDATCCRLMGIDPARIRYLEHVELLGNTGVEGIEQRGERVDRLRRNFELMPEFKHLRLA